VTAKGDARMSLRQESSAEFNGRRRRRKAIVSSILSITATLLVVLAVSACDELTRPITVTVRNLCVGPNYTVYVYINDGYRGLVTSSVAFRDVTPGAVRLRAVGTGYGGSTFLNDRIAFGSFTWTLCGGGGTLSLEGEVDED
jgi:hypothetical protein